MYSHKYEKEEENISYDVNFYVEYSDIKDYLKRPGVFSYMKKECIKDIKQIKEAES